MTQEFDISRFIDVREKMERAEAFIIEEAEKIGLTLTKEQACIFANAVLKAYGL